MRNVCIKVIEDDWPYSGFVFAFGLFIFFACMWFEISKVRFRAFDL